MSDFFSVILILLFIPGLAIISVKIGSIKNERDRQSFIGIMLLITVVLTSLFHSYKSRSSLEKRMLSCEIIKSKVIGFQGKYTNADLSEEGLGIYEECIGK